MKSKKFFFLAILSSVLLLGSCAKKRNLVYFSDVQQNEAFQTAITNAHEPRIQPGDIMGINVSSLDPASNAMFNTGALQTYSGTNSASGTTTNLGKEGYLVGKDGSINFPIIGKIELQGLTLTESLAKMESELLKFVKDPIVNINYLNFKVTVIGEVNRPGSFSVDKDKINVLEALGNAGDMTAYGKRENVLIIREYNGKREMARLNLNSSSSFNSPYFYLQQNDMVYVQPDIMKERQVSRDNYYIATTASLLSILTVILTRIF